MNILKQFGAKMFPSFLGQKTNQFNSLGNKSISNSARFAELSYKHSMPENMEGYGEYLPKYSNDGIRVYKDDKNKTINMSIRGTDLSDKSRALQDLKSDALGVFLGKKEDDPRFYEASRLTDTLRHKFKDYKINSFGHSLGGSISKYISDKHPEVKSVVFNAGSSPLVREQKQSNVVQYRSSGDLISAFNNPSNTGGTFYSNPLMGHSITNFTQ
jgi:hypothetical protein